MRTLIMTTLAALATVPAVASAQTFHDADRAPAARLVQADWRDHDGGVRYGYGEVYRDRAYERGAYGYGYAPVYGDGYGYVPSYGRRDDRPRFERRGYDFDRRHGW